jgi:hypothetical protein
MATTYSINVQYIQYLVAVLRKGQYIVYFAELFSSSCGSPLDLRLPNSLSSTITGVRLLAPNEGNFVNRANLERNVRRERNRSCENCRSWSVPRSFLAKWSDRSHHKDGPGQVSAVRTGGARVKLRGSSLPLTVPGTLTSNAKGSPSRGPFFWIMRLLPHACSAHRSCLERNDQSRVTRTRILLTNPASI